MGVRRHLDDNLRRLGPAKADNTQQSADSTRWSRIIKRSCSTQDECRSARAYLPLVVIIEAGDISGDSIHDTPEKTQENHLVKIANAVFLRNRESLKRFTGRGNNGRGTVVRMYIDFLFDCCLKVFERLFDDNRLLIFRRFGIMLFFY